MDKIKTSKQWLLEKVVKMGRYDRDMLEEFEQALLSEGVLNALSWRAQDAIRSTYNLALLDRLRGFITNAEGPLEEAIYAFERHLEKERYREPWRHNTSSLIDHAIGLEKTTAIHRLLMQLTPLRQDLEKFEEDRSIDIETLRHHAVLEGFEGATVWPEGARPVVLKNWKEEGILATPKKKLMVVRTLGKNYKLVELTEDPLQYLQIALIHNPGRRWRDAIKALQSIAKKC